MTDNLEHLFLHYSTTEEDEAELREALKAEIERLTNVIGEWSRQVGGLPQARHPSRLIDVCDEAISHALRACDNRDYAATFARLQQARRTVADLQKAWEANLAYEAMLEAYQALEALPAWSNIKPLLTLQDLALLLDETASLLQRGKYLQGELLSRACRRRSETLGEQLDITPQELQPRLQQLLALCDEVRMFLPPGRMDWADKCVLSSVETLLLNGHCALAERLLNDLEVELTPHRAFLAIYQQLRPTSAPPLVSDADLRALIAAESWSAATSYLLYVALVGLGERVAEVPAKASIIQEQITAAQKLFAAQ
jgi:hypothetical protein